MNAKWLIHQKLAEDERASSNKPAKVQSGGLKRTISRRGAYTTITFSEVEDWPEILNDDCPIPTVPNNVCNFIPYD